uniref:Uncharacterized protein n=1 Tax=Setaria italica TaxID=4555 RepID=K4A4C0_SETIT
MESWITYSITFVVKKLECLEFFRRKLLRCHLKMGVI